MLMLFTESVQINEIQGTGEKGIAMTQNSLDKAGAEAGIENEPEALWYSQKDGFFGNLKLYHFTSLIFLLGALALVLLFVRKIPQGAPDTRCLRVGIGGLYPIRSWLKTWARRFDEDTRQRERTCYALMRDRAKSF